MAVNKSFVLLFRFIVLSLAAMATALADVATAPTVDVPGFGQILEFEDVGFKEKDFDLEAKLFDEDLKVDRNFLICITPPKQSTPILGSIAKVVCNESNNVFDTMNNNEERQSNNSIELISSPADEDAYGFFSMGQSFSNCTPFLNDSPLPECYNDNAEVIAAFLEKAKYAFKKRTPGYDKGRKLGWFKKVVRKQLFVKYPELMEKCCFS